MEHKSISRMLLIAGAVVALFAAAVLFAAVPITIFTVLDISLFRKLLTLAVYVFIAYFAFAALIKYARICVMIGRNQSFSRENVVNMDKIAKYLFCCGGCFLLTIFTLWANITYCRRPGQQNSGRDDQGPQPRPQVSGGGHAEAGRSRTLAGI